MATSTPDGRTRAWVLDLVVGGTVGGVVGSIVAVNVVIFAGMDRGYESSPADVFEQNPLVGLLVLVVLLGGPVLGVMTARRIRRGR